MKTCYLDNAATMPMLAEVKSAMVQALEAGYGNASALHSAGHMAKMAIEEARARVAELIHASPEEIIFTSGGSEANNAVMETFRGERVAVSAIEHLSVLAAAKARASELRIIPVDEWGFIDADKIVSAIEGCNLVSVMLANNELGSIEPVAEIVKRCKENNILVHTDATQALGKIHIDVQELGVDYLTMSAHKIGGPIGIGALYVRKGSPYTPLIYGGHQESQRRAGTSNTLGIIGFGAAAKWCWDNWSCKEWEKTAALRDELKVRILEGIPYSSCNSPSEHCLPNMLNMSFVAAEGESTQLYLDAEVILVSTGSACAAGDVRPSHVLMATRGDAEVAHSSIRFSLGLDTIKEDIDYVMQVLPKVVRRLQSISTIKISAESGTSSAES